ncbi:tripartite tricarboxylate transporter substrate binding protein [Cupriavidus sp. amp6]|uniref:Bug family tripartite tricarboxylate transporter substrate binding protein n=1 Tax=Cupriavidus sp. amp6 TaxID=388051 RepID=UPI0018DE1445|nr:tripartite tricarboxylate transporter substrate binding protein [Cupriavidus sp. amp6]
MSRRRTLGAIALAPSMAFQWWPVTARGEDWPAKPLRIVVSATAGSSIDALARIYAEHLGNALKQSVVVENKPGANQTIGIGAIRSAPADGYSILMASTELVRVPLLYPKLRYDPFREFIPLLQVAETSSYLCVPTSLQVSTLQEFLAHARRAQQPVSIGSPGQGSAAHFYSELLARAAQVRAEHVPYKGEVPLVPDLLAGRIDAGWLSGNLVTQYVNQNKLRVLAVGSMKHRVASMPAVPTFTELGVPGLDIEGFLGLVALSGTPTPIVERLTAELIRIRQRTDVREKVESYGFEATRAGSRVDFHRTMKASHDGWQKAISKAQISLDS